MVILYIIIFFFLFSFVYLHTSANKSFSLPTGGELYSSFFKRQSKNLFLFANFQGKKLL